MNKLEKTIQQLETKIFPFRPSMKPEPHILYQNEETGTVVYQIITSNYTMEQMVTVPYTWNHFLAGDNDGYLEGSGHLLNGSAIRIDGVEETDDQVVVKRSGSYIGTWDIKFEAEDIVFKKDEFKPYEAKEPEE